MYDVTADVDCDTCITIASVERCVMKPVFSSLQNMHHTSSSSSAAAAAAAAATTIRMEMFNVQSKTDRKSV